MRVCLNCGKSIEEKQISAKYCSHNCSKNRNDKIMRRTNPIFVKKQSDYYKKWYQKNKEKHNEYMRNYFKYNGNERSNIRKYAYRVLRKQILEKYNNKCCKCGSSDNLEIHHLNYNVKENTKTIHTIEQITLLCRKCHREIHRSEI